MFDFYIREKPPSSEELATAYKPYIEICIAVFGVNRSMFFAADLYGAFPVKRLLLGFARSSLFGAGKAVLHPVACDPVRGARGRGQGTETLAELGGLPP
jgi:hypothetical protein